MIGFNSEDSNIEEGLEPTVFLAKTKLSTTKFDVQIKELDVHKEVKFVQAGKLTPTVSGVYI